MTANQIAYAVHVEQKRHNVVSEYETERHNRATETETNRHNVAFEIETYRHNKATEVEMNRHNVVFERETERHNRASEGIGWAQARAAQTAANARMVAAKAQQYLSPYQAENLMSSTWSNYKNASLISAKTDLTKAQTKFTSAQTSLEQQKSDWYWTEAGRNITGMFSDISKGISPAITALFGGG